jgi:DNA-binding NarL/FixJ family response regulator
VGHEPGVVHLVARGLSDAEIAAGFHLGEATVKSHVARVLAELGVRDRVQTAVFCCENGIVRPGRPGRQDRG